MNNKKSINKCYTYFSIYGKFIVEELCELLSVEPVDFWQGGDASPDGKIYDESYISCNICEKYNVYTTKQMEETIKPFANKIDLLVELKEKYNLKYYLVVVPYLHVGEVAPAIAPNAKVVEFCYKTGTEFDFDLYVEE